VKRITRPMLGFQSFDAAQSTLVGIELMYMLRKRQLEDGVEQGLTVAEQFYALAASSPHGQGQLPLQLLLSTICYRTISCQCRFQVPSVRMSLIGENDHLSHQIILAIARA
jgi:hypothetical protein